MPGRSSRLKKSSRNRRGGRGGSDEEDKRPNRNRRDMDSSYGSSSNSENSDSDGSILDPIDPNDFPRSARARLHKIQVLRSMNISRTNRLRASIESIIQFMEGLNYSFNFLRRYNREEDFCLRCFQSENCGCSRRDLAALNLQYSSCSSCRTTSSSSSSEDDGTSLPNRVTISMGQILPDVYHRVAMFRRGRSRRRQRRRRNSPATASRSNSYPRTGRNNEQINLPQLSGQESVAQTTRMNPSCSSLACSIRKLQMIQAMRRGCVPRPMEDFKTGLCGKCFRNPILMNRQESPMNRQESRMNRQEGPMNRQKHSTPSSEGGNQKRSKTSPAKPKYPLDKKSCGVSVRNDEDASFGRLDKSLCKVQGCELCDMDSSNTSDSSTPDKKDQPQNSDPKENTPRASTEENKPSKNSNSDDTENSCGVSYTQPCMIPGCEHCGPDESIFPRLCDCPVIDLCSPPSPERSSPEDELEGLFLWSSSRKPEGHVDNSGCCCKKCKGEDDSSEESNDET